MPDELCFSFQASNAIHPTLRIIPFGYSLSKSPRFPSSFAPLPLLPDITLFFLIYQPKYVLELCGIDLFLRVEEGDYRWGQMTFGKWTLPISTSLVPA